MKTWICLISSFKLPTQKKIYLHMKTVVQGRNSVILRGGRRYIYSRKDEIIYALCPSVKCVKYIGKIGLSNAISSTSMSTQETTWLII